MDVDTDNIVNSDEFRTTSAMSTALAFDRPGNTHIPQHIWSPAISTTTTHRAWEFHWRPRTRYNRLRSVPIATQDNEETRHRPRVPSRGDEAVAMAASLMIETDQSTPVTVLHALLLDLRLMTYAAASEAYMISKEAMIHEPLQLQRHSYETGSETGEVEVSYDTVSFAGFGPSTVNALEQLLSPTADTGGEAEEADATILVAWAANRWRPVECPLSALSVPGVGPPRVTRFPAEETMDDGDEGEEIPAVQYTHRYGHHETYNEMPTTPLVPWA